jgi:ABC-2 type transport system permease protein
MNYIWELILQAGFYATPVLYPVSKVIDISPFAAQLMILNPVAQIIQDARFFVVTRESLTLSNIYGGMYMYAVPILFVIVLAVVGVLYFKKKSPSFAEDI